MLTIDDLKKQKMLLFEAVSGSHSYGLANEKSDIDIKGVYVLPQDIIYGFEYIGQLNDERYDQVYYEVGKFLKLLGDNNPNILEMLFIDKEFIRFEDPLFGKIRKFNFLSKKARDTFANYALAQIKKARGLNKKMNNHFDKKRKSILEFCYVIQKFSTVPLIEFLKKNELNQEDCGLIKLKNSEEIYLLFHADNNQYRGIVKKEVSEDLAISSVAKNDQPIAQVIFNRNAFNSYCKGYKEYWNWVEQRNKERYNLNLSHGKKYDSKNLMHTIRLLTMAEEIAAQNLIKVKRDDRDFFLKIKSGFYSYDELLQMAEDKMKNIEESFAKSNLPNRPDPGKIEQLLISIRKEFYKRV